jgi:hypothetical protein
MVRRIVDCMIPSKAGMVAGKTCFLLMEGNRDSAILGQVMKLMIFIAILIEGCNNVIPDDMNEAAFLVNGRQWIGKLVGKIHGP